MGLNRYAHSVEMSREPVQTAVNLDMHLQLIPHFQLFFNFFLMNPLFNTTQTLQIQKVTNYKLQVSKE